MSFLREILLNMQSGVNCIIMNVNCWNVIGLMSGTSLDGVDLVYATIVKSSNNYSFYINFSSTVPYSKLWEQNLRNAFISEEKEISKLSIDYGFYLGELVNKFILKHKIKIEEVDFIASHGHTVFHKPDEGYTLQIGDGETIRNVTGIKVICDFRTQDVLLGGQGAPLVPIGDRLLFSEYDYCLNLGGFANISFEKDGNRIAFDICPVNIVLNYYVNKLGFSFDDKGITASTGKVNMALLKTLNDINFYTVPAPKSLGFEFVEKEILPLIDNFNLKIEDILRTFVAHIVTQISICLDTRVTSKVLVTGGGVFNDFLMNELKNYITNEIVTPTSIIIDYKEALIFGLLGVLKSENKVNCLCSVTGAKKDHCSGKIFEKQL